MHVISFTKIRKQFRILVIVLLVLVAAAVVVPIVARIRGNEVVPENTDPSGVFEHIGRFVARTINLVSERVRPVVNTLQRHYRGD